MTRKRFYGIDYLRIIALISIVTLHTLNRSELLKSSIQSQYNTAWLLETIAYFGADCFGMISGFVSYSDQKQSLKMKAIIEKWFEVEFYCLLLLLSFVLFSNYQIDKNVVKIEFLPLLYGHYWYFSAYIGVFFLSVFINNAIRETDNRTLIKYLFIIFTVFITFETISNQINSSYTVSHLLNGYCFAWLLLMYIIGAIVRKTGIYHKLQIKKSIWLIFVSILISYIWLIWCGSYVRIGGYYSNRIFLKYTSPTIVVVALCMLCIFASINITESHRWFPSFLGKRSFAIYILNSNYLIEKHIYNKKNLSFLLRFDGISLVIFVVLTVICWVIISVIVDSFRIILFDKLNIDGLCKIITRGLAFLYQKIIKALNFFSV